jgi:hypothetical protein
MKKDIFIEKVLDAGFDVKECARVPSFEILISDDDGEHLAAIISKEYERELVIFDDINKCEPGETAVIAGILSEFAMTPIRER